MHARRNDQAGDTLLEILISIVIIGISMSVLFYAFSISTSRSGIHQDLVTANGILRSYAESTKAAVRDQVNGCGKSSPTNFTVTYTLPAQAVTNGFTVSSSPTLTPHSCPSTTGVLPVTLSVTMPHGEGTKTLDIDVRTP